MKNSSKLTAIIVTNIMVIAVNFLIAAPAKAQNILTSVNQPVKTVTPAQIEEALRNNPDISGQWIALTSLFNLTGTNAASTNDSMNASGNFISQLIALNWLFGSGNNFNNLDQISKWIVLTGLFGTGQQFPPSIVK